MTALLLIGAALGLIITPIGVTIAMYLRAKKESDEIVEDGEVMSRSARDEEIRDLSKKVASAGQHDAG